MSDQDGSAGLPHEAHLAALASLDAVGPARLRWLLSLGSPAEVWRRVQRGGLPRTGANPSLGIDHDLRERWRRDAHPDRPAQLWRRCEDAGIGVVALGGAGYPEALADDPDPPVVLFSLGDLDALAGRRVAVIGTRHATGYGRAQARSLGEGLGRAGVSVVSGLALGVDAAAHHGAVVSDAAPVGVVGGGLDAPCPVPNRPLARQVARLGALLSEVPPGVRAAPWRFPVRNRVIAALAEVLVVVESGPGGGSMHTVREALTRGRTVMALPGPVDSPVSVGTNQLLADGATVCTGAEDVLVALGLGGTSRSPAVADRPDPRPAPAAEEAALLDQLGWRPLSVEALAAGSGVGLVGTSVALVGLERKGWVRRSGGWVERVGRPPPAR